jgi:putative aldouronate transport system substrate-binding protein
VLLPSLGAKPDLPPNDAGLQAGYFTYPKDLVQTVPTAPGRGGDVSIFTETPYPPPTALSDNPLWQGLQQAVNANLKFQLAPFSDYPTVTATVMAGSDLPDLFFFHSSLTLANIPQFLKASYTDLTPYLAGDAAKDFPNLAALPSSAWAQSVIDGAIYTVPLVRPFVNYSFFANRNLFATIGAGDPTNADDFARIIKELTQPQSNVWGIGAAPPTYGLLGATQNGDCPQLSIFGVPNNWSVDANGTFTKDFETDEFRAALGFVRDLYAAGCFYPEPNLNAVSMRASFKAGKYAVQSLGWPAYVAEFWNQALKQNPPVVFRTLPPFRADGGQPITHQFQGVQGKTAIKKSSPDRVKELLGILNFLAAPFGSKEYHLLNYGTQDVDFSFDANGNPVLTDKGAADNNIGPQYVVVPPQVLFNPSDAEYVKEAYAEQQAIVPHFVADPSAPLYSGTNQAKGGQIIQPFADGLGDLVTGRAPLTNLDDLVRTWRTSGGDQIRSEFQQAYAATQR